MKKQPLNIVQNPSPGSHLLMFRGDTQTFTLTLSQKKKGSAWLRTNLGHAHIQRSEIIRHVEMNAPPLGRDWFDIPMNPISPQQFHITLGMGEVGHFEAKCFFIEDGGNTPIWPPGSNTVINVEPADTCGANIIYNAFVRQFGPGKERGLSPLVDPDHIKTCDKAGYTVIPPSGTFRDLISNLDFIVGELGCRIIQLLPIHPTPTTYARMGRFGSPYAALSFTAVDPALAEFDPRATPMEQFLELVDAVHARCAKLFLDIAINHTGWAANLHEIHPEWLVRDADGKIEAPGAWGVVWADLTRLDYSYKDLWQFMADVFLTWCRRGVDGFRCDAGYMIPVPAWQYIIARVREEFPDTVFLLEGLGGKISVTRELLNSANFNWAYSELFQNYDRQQIESYLPGAIEISETNGVVVHYAETHDNQRLASTSNEYARMRTALCALLSPNGAFGFANGVEWFATEKINVHDSTSLNWNAAINQVKEIQRLNLLLKTHPAFYHPVRLRLIQRGNGNFIALKRRHTITGKQLLILANLDMQNPVRAEWDPEEVSSGKDEYIDLLEETPVISFDKDGRRGVELAPGQILCLSDDPQDLKGITASASKMRLPTMVRQQRLNAKALDVIRFYRPDEDISDIDLHQATRELETDPIVFCRHLNPFSRESRVITWTWPRDLRREVMVPPNHFLLIKAPHPFRGRIMENNKVVAVEESMENNRGYHFGLFAPILSDAAVHRRRKLQMAVYGPSKAERREAELLYLSRPEETVVQTLFQRKECFTTPLLALGTNGRGGMMRAGAPWGNLNSRYDALLAANLHPDFPDDRQIMLARCRAWIVFQGYSQEIGLDCLDAFGFDYSTGGYWQYHVPTGQGEHVQLIMRAQMSAGENTFHLTVHRHIAENSSGRLADHKPIQLIIRPDIEDRNFHHTCKAYTGPEHQWPAAVTFEKQGFVFAPHVSHRLITRLDAGEFVPEPEWQYAVHRPLEAERGLDPDSDLFSPGYFTVMLSGGETATLTARAATRTEDDSDFHFLPADRISTWFQKAPRVLDLADALQQALNHYLVKRSGLSTVIAGYPWFLDWGRDTLIVVRGLIAAGRHPEVKAILEHFARFEKNGTLPNMIRGADAGNRNTSDAPLWFFTACADLVNAEGKSSFLKTDCGGRTLRSILISMAQSLVSGTPNGIRMDPDSGLLFSPAHFTWMDTNHPTGTPRKGYPIEIQSLWFAALKFLTQIETSKASRKWETLAAKVRESVHNYFYLEENGYLSDCLHCDDGTAAASAEADDALRPNQLLAITLGAVDDRALCTRILSACEELLVPGAIRSLADRPVHPPLEIRYQDKVINTPGHPYQGKYRGDEDTRRKPAYHNGTAWTWPFPGFCEAWARVYGDEGRDTALAWLTSSTLLINQGCAGHVPEILDGDFPHTPRGCDAQAWGVSELLRVWLLLDPDALI
ncbi:amylo-alpha-1,6-glucosidase [Thermodesulfobacteriota bacterium]